MGRFPVVGAPQALGAPGGRVKGLTRPYRATAETGWIWSDAAA